MDRVFGGTYVEHIAKLFKILGDANRLCILLTIGKSERSVSQIIEATSLSQTLVSFHLRALRDAGIVTAERQGAFIYYRLANADLLDLVSEFQEYASKETAETEKVEFPCPCPPMGKKYF
ncbi:metalloregulator ArsR/SmtB family transcription factor [Pelotomaculum isophthalicicum JI]|uniref:Metalloregulator ArsR/SmtB family transcription factor n=1 Tax=Pelotomaculum isophthalicicum JI TaxID=947010 RepID=A0A9X4H093_9FIRM|nr:metalloregulator ArsR/SmtB family transcription factor [Pelotomaculum isophthalicicum]MDF9409635.1 metalloregulator ArsR/SmtB family transcription factor [Pelotomaculum isophthalicicum JI]